MSKLLDAANLAAHVASPIRRRCVNRVRTPFLPVLAVLIHAGAAPAFAQDAPTAPRQWALLIGVEKYHRATPLRYTINDVRQLADTLHQRGGFPRDQIREMTDQETNPRFQPFKASLQAELPQWLKQPGPNDQIIVYFSGHGFRDDAGKLYLAPLDCDPRDPAATAISVEWLREQIATCPAAFKLLIIDACHAGSEKGPEDDGDVTAKDLGDLFQGLEKVVTLASSSAGEKSQIWEDKQQSLFTFWLNQGLKGHADKDGDGVIDVDELYDYVSRAVKHTAQTRFPRPQEPRRIVRAGVDGVPAIVRLRPQTLKQVMADIAEQLALALDERRVGKVGVLEFTNDTPVGELLGAKFGLLGRYCSEELERRLMDEGTGKFSVVDRRRLQAALSQQNFEISDLGSDRALKQLSEEVGGMPVIVLGTLRNRFGPQVTLQCKLVQTEGDEVLASAGGTAVLNESEWAMLGGSVHVRPEDRPPPTITDQPETETAIAVPNAELIGRLDELAEGAHPLLNPNFPFRVWLTVGRLDAAGKFQGEDRQGVFRGNDLLVPVRKGEVIHVHIECKTDQLGLMRLLVDGLNTLPERIENTVVDNGETKGVVTYQWGQHVNLSEARPWVLDPARSRVFAVRGFVTETGKDGKLREFTVVEADKSLAARQQFTDQLGIITAAFYYPSSTGRSVAGQLGIGAGQERAEDLTERAAPAPGSLLGVVHIRYVDADALAAEVGSSSTGPGSSGTGATSGDSDSGSVSGSQAPTQSAPDKCVIQLDVPDGATIFVDGRDRGTQRTITWNGLEPEKRYISQFRIRFPGGGEAQRAIAVFGGRTATVAAHEPSRIVYSGSSDAGGSGIHSFQLDSSSRRRITDGNDSSPALSPDGRQVVFVRYAGARKYDLCAVSVDGTGLRRLIADSQSPIYGPRWSPDGNQILFYKRLGEATETWVISADGHESRPLIKDAGNADWSPSSDRLVFSVFVQGVGNEVYTIRPDGTDRRRLGNGWGPAWSPDGDRIAFTDGGRLGIMDRDGKVLSRFPLFSGRKIARLERLPHTFANINPRWSPDGRQIVYELVATAGDADEASESALYLVNADGTGNRVLVQPPPATTFGGAAVTGPDWR